MTVKTYEGLSDTPLSGSNAKDDLLNLGHYHKGLSNFIQKCSTPLTIAIQGSWGSGKTSTMKFVMRDLQKNRNIECLEFNTWQYSQFDMGDSLVFNLLQDLAEKIAPDETKKSKFGRALKKVFLQAASTATYATASRFGVDAQLQAAVSVFQDAYEGESRVPTLASQLKELREDFQSDVREYLARKTKISLNELTEEHRLVIFIDDLDRIEATRAIQLLEALKLFLEIKQCVFVLAIDYDVVAQGVSKKFGFEEDSFKTRQYFDKIIQVPFRLPDVAYEIEGILSPYFQKIGIDEKNYTKQFASFAKNSIGTNPRSLKRTLNSFALLKTIIIPAAKDSYASETPADEDIITFALLCMQSAYPHYYTEFLRSLDDPDRINELLPSNIDEGVSAIEEDWRIPVFSEQNFNAFRSQFYELFVKDTQEGEISPDALKKSLGFTSLTAVTSSGDKPENIIDSDSDIYLTAEQRIKQVKSHGVGANVSKTLKTFDDAVEEHNSNQPKRPICIIQLKGRRWNIYSGSNQQEIVKMAPRARPKIAEIHYGNSKIMVAFGNSNAKRNFAEGEDHVSEQWQRAETRIEKLFESQAKLLIERRTSGYALAIRGVDESDDVPILMEAIEIILDEYLSHSK